MTPPLPTHSHAESASAPAPAVRPYAGPRETIASRPLMHRSAPYRPQVVRTAAPSPSPTGDLPWIDQFLSNTPVASVAAIETAQTQAADENATERAAGVETRTPTIVSDVWVTPQVAVSVDVATTVTIMPTPPTSAPLAADTPVGETSVSDAAPADGWPLEEASAQLAEMLPALRRIDHDTPARLFSERHVDETLPEWSDDDMIDIMPLGTVAPHTMAQRHTLPVEPQSEPAGIHSNGEAAARALELIAQRVRSGELALPGYDPALGDSAALIAALAALHGVR